MKTSEANIEDLKGMVVSDGTMRSEDLIPKFLNVLKIYGRDVYDKYVGENPEVLDLSGMDDETMGWVVDELFDKLNEIAPEGYSFGSQDGDGACYGFWSVDADERKKCEAYIQPVTLYSTTRYDDAEAVQSFLRDIGGDAVTVDKQRNGDVLSVNVSGSDDDVEAFVDTYKNEYGSIVKDCEVDATGWTAPEDIYYIATEQGRKELRGESKKGETKEDKPVWGVIVEYTPVNGETSRTDVAPSCDTEERAKEAAIARVTKDYGPLKDVKIIRVDRLPEWAARNIRDLVRNNKTESMSNRIENTTITEQEFSDILNAYVKEVEGNDIKPILIEVLKTEPVEGDGTLIKFHYDARENGWSNARTYALVFGDLHKNRDNDLIYVLHDWQSGEKVTPKDTADHDWELVNNHIRPSEILDATKSSESLDPSIDVKGRGVVELSEDDYLKLSRDINSRGYCKDKNGAYNVWIGGSFKGTFPSVEAAADAGYTLVEGKRCEALVSEKTFKQGVDEFIGAAPEGGWSDYWAMQQDWEFYTDSLCRDGVITQKQADSWSNPCTPDTFDRWQKRNGLVHRGYESKKSEARPTKQEEQIKELCKLCRNDKNVAESVFKALTKDYNTSLDPVLAGQYLTATWKSKLEELGGCNGWYDGFKKLYAAMGSDFVCSVLQDLKLGSSGIGCGACITIVSNIYDKVVKRNEAKKSEADGDKDVYTIDLYRIDADGDETALDDMQAAQTFYDEDEAIKVANELADSYADYDDVVFAVVMAGEREKPNGDIVGEPFDIYWASSSDKQKTAKYREKANYIKTDGLDYYAKGGKSEARMSESKKNEEKILFKDTEIPNELKQVYNACKKRFYCEPNLVSMVDSLDNGYYKMNGSYGSDVKIRVEVGHEDGKFIVSVDGLDETTGYHWETLGKGESENIKQAIDSAMAEVDKNLMPFAIKIHKAIKGESKKSEAYEPRMTPSWGPEDREYTQAELTGEDVLGDFFLQALQYLRKDLGYSYDLKQERHLLTKLTRLFDKGLDYKKAIDTILSDESFCARTGIRKPAAEAKKSETCERMAINDYANKRFYDPDEFVKYVRKVAKDGSYLSVDSVVSMDILNKANRLAQNNGFKKSESLTLKQKELKDMVRYGEAEDITTISDVEAKELKKKGIETVGISRGVYGMNGALLRDSEGKKYVITARSSNLFYFV